MSTLNDQCTVEQIMETFPIGKVVRGFRTAGRLDWQLGRIMGVERRSTDGEPLGLIVQFFSDGGKIDYPFELLNMTDESFVVDVDKRDVVREFWPVGLMAMARMVGRGWIVCVVKAHTEYGIRLSMEGGETIFRWEDFGPDGRCAGLMKLKKKK